MGLATDKVLVSFYLIQFNLVDYYAIIIIGAGDMCNHGSFYTCQDNYNPKKLLNHKWENCMKIDSVSWGN
jgi:hypothetical protein